MEEAAVEVTEAVAEATASRTPICDCRIMRPAEREDQSGLRMRVVFLLRKAGGKM